VGHSKGYAKGKVKAISACIKKTETSQINNLMMYLKLLEKNKNKPNLKPAGGEK
jgi:hypothetical protein